MSTKKTIPPHLRCDYDIPVVAAAQAMVRGEATADQQRGFMNWLINVAAGTYNQSFMESGDRETVFAEGRRFVGLQTVKLTKLSLNALRKANDHV